MKERAKFKLKIVVLTEDLAEYKIHYGPASKQYTEEVDVGLPDSIDGLVKYKK